MNTTWLTRPIHLIAALAALAAVAVAVLIAADYSSAKGKVVRKGPFKEPVTVKVNGLPAGLKADPVTVSADASEFTLTPRHRRQ